ncbi:hypothetical protein OI25_2842 [Paraburkholderia fungorum]|uniref:Uncharacterized protein n=1 Tax=Paraburkholderia fungorum TaxID=134537 RepID=A0AAU8TG65_9BURK|nr:hypothetical protein OI25_2842 [Paraburkholderia fungorum]
MLYAGRMRVGGLQQAFNSRQRGSCNVPWTGTLCRHVAPAKLCTLALGPYFP